MRDSQRWPLIIFDKTKNASPSIGALAVAESDPNVIYVGTGEACIRGNIVAGDGVYKSLDLADWLASNPRALLATNFGVSEEVIAKLAQGGTIV